jgi:hypothetical protein
MKQNSGRSWPLSRLTQQNQVQGGRSASHCVSGSDKKIEFSIVPLAVIEKVACFPCNNAPQQQQDNS